MTQKFNKPKDRPEELPGKTYQYNMLCGRKVYITVTFSEDTGDMQEIFLKMGKENGGEDKKRPNCQIALVESIGRTISNYLRAECDPKDIIESLSDIRCGFSSPNSAQPKSCPDAIADVIRKEMYNKKICYRCGREVNLKEFRTKSNLPFILCNECAEQDVGNLIEIGGI